MKSTMKKIVGIASTVLLGGMLAACGNGSDSGGASSGDKGLWESLCLQNQQNVGLPMETIW